MAATGTLSYLTCTAAQAKEFNERNPHNIVSLNQLLETRAVSHPRVSVACFPEYIPEEDRWRLLTFTFGSLLSVSDALATYYVDNTALTVRRAEDTTDRIVALLSPSCADLLVTLFSAIRLGYGVLLLAPQNTPEAVAHLCRTTNATHLVCHDSLVAQAQVAIQNVKEFSIVPLAPRTAWKTPSRQLRFGLRPEIEKDLTALVMHTSGSTGMPKGGSADLLRSMNAVSTLYLFSSTYPMTVKNIAGALAVCPGVDAFLSVPYILKMLAEHEDGLEILRVMSLVSTGGAPLPEARSTPRQDYENDKEWSWLRNLGLGARLLHFEPMGNSEGEGVFELVVDKEWTTRIVSNRSDGSFASGDLYAKHPTIPDAWRYHGRTDDIVVLVTGKKVSANPIETALRACPVVSEAIVFGAGRPALGVLILPASATVTKDDILERVHLVNASQSSYAHLLDDLVIVLPLDAGPTIPKTSKGSVTRPKALGIFAETINEAYKRLDNGIVGTHAIHEDVISHPTDDQIRAYLRSAVADVLQVAHGSGKGIAPSQSVDDNEDLFNAGIDSVRAVLVRSRLQKLVATHGKSISNNVVFEHPSIMRLVQHVIQVLDGDEDYLDPASTTEGRHRLMLELVEAYNVKTTSLGAETASKFQYSPTADTAGAVILTGVTGSLGVHVLAQILVRTHLRVIALVRASSNAEALERVKTNLAKRKLLKYYYRHQERVEAFASDLRHERLGLADATYGVCLESAVAVVHIAWPVNFAMSLDSFRPALDGTHSETQHHQ
ncbi:hypothetical protein PHLGIDRAFT_16917 [Phlebiopsis gigantea 11061_1 CR5-6]|uniref:Carrier domain-containing protein n=1 Tax=Phlebiopsis gigantea (strain 11061_1 CR5-6) TaxID=745531 RepID=A0A0C3NBP0_PHLG1|nr:hypothetical protein PHLGIDRAFT_16917 [Phlebiopsis gigantea 11061_1 CR5-6]